ncbi:cupin domain-containing protein [bacterium]|nr:MAG: cupin domain-containing protein [bacterium]
MNSLYSIPPELPGPEEFSETLVRSGEVVVERIISHGQSTPSGEWFDQERHEWVALLQGSARLMFSDGATLEMHAGDWTFIPAHRRHRVEQTTTNPPCIWIALHFPSHPS